LPTGYLLKFNLSPKEKMTYSSVVQPGMETTSRGRSISRATASQGFRRKALGAHYWITELGRTTVPSALCFICRLQFV
ncbi:mCG146003, partial [Mus musculus]